MVVLDQKHKMNILKIYLHCCCLSILIVTSRCDLSRLMDIFVSKFSCTRSVKSDILEFFKENIKFQSINVKLILAWYSVSSQVIPHLTTGQIFRHRNCSVDNCFITTNQRLLKSLSDFDAIVFHGPDLFKTYIPVPTERSPQQKYIFASSEPSDQHPIITWKFRKFFNWTMTHKLNSDIYMGTFVIRDRNGEIVGPKRNMQWIPIENMSPINISIREKLDNKTKAAAWILTDCSMLRQAFVKGIMKQMAKHGLILDIFGKCGKDICSGYGMKDCLSEIEKDYYFYFAFEDAVSADYVTEQLLYAINHYAVPVVYGGADYTRFMPNGTYLNVRKLDPVSLVHHMLELMTDRMKQYNYFKWHNHYHYHMINEATDSDYFCKFCEKLNNETEFKRETVIDDMKYWWSHDL